MLDPQTRDMLKQAVGITDADLEKLTPNILKVLARAGEFPKYKFVAEVTDSKYCFVGVEKGQKYVFSSMPLVLLPEESSAPLCMRALGPLTGFLNNMMDRVMEGSDPNEMLFQSAECLDPGVGNGGLGKVRFKVYAEKVA